MPTLISDFGPYIWLAVITAGVFATFDTGERFGYNALTAAFAAMLFGFTGLGFYIQCAVFFAVMTLMDLAADVAEIIIRRKNKK